MQARIELMKIRTPARRAARPGFTLIELLTVIGIIVILIAILVPTIAAVRKNAYSADSQQHMVSIANALQRYYDDFRAYPGPFRNSQITAGVTATGAGGNITQTENGVLGLMGGLEPGAPNPSFDPTKVGL